MTASDNKKEVEMGHREALQKKIENGQCRLLMDPSVRQDQALAWLAGWGFSTSAILVQLYLSKADLPEMRKKGLVLSKLIDVAVTANSRSRQMRIVYLSAKGRRYLRQQERGCYLPPVEPASVLRHHNYLCQVVAAAFILKNFTDAIQRWMCFEYKTAGMMQHKPINEIGRGVPDFYIFDKNTRTKHFFELERASTIDRYLKERAAADRKKSTITYSIDANSAATLSRFFLKIDHLSSLGKVKLIYTNPAARVRAQSYFESLLSVGIPLVWKEGKSWRVWEGEYDCFTGDYANVEWLNVADVADPKLIPGSKT